MFVKNISACVRQKEKVVKSKLISHEMTGRTCSHIRETWYSVLLNLKAEHSFYSLLVKTGFDMFLLNCM